MMEIKIRPPRRGEAVEVITAIYLILILVLWLFGIYDDNVSITKTIYASILLSIVCAIFAYMFEDDNSNTKEEQNG